jgi:hypothetical protein
MNGLSLLKLFDGLDGDDLLPDDAAFHAELDKRLEDVSNGTASLIPWDEARDNLRAELQRRRIGRQARSET